MVGCFLLSVGTPQGQSKAKPTTTMNPTLETATLGSGCFWCTEAVYLSVKGVKEVVSGYSGGKVKNPTYREVCSGLTGHAEVVQVKFDPAIISYEGILEIFWNILYLQIRLKLL